MSLELVSRLIAEFIVGCLLSLAALWGWNHLFGWAHTFEYTFMNVLAVIALACFFTKVSANK